MTEPVVYRINTATCGQLAEHLQRCDTQFVPELSARVDIGEYAKKIANRAVRLEAWSDDSLVGLVAAYGDDALRRIAFVTSVSVLRDWTGLGIGTRLMRDCVEYAKLNGLRRISLEVAVEQRLAVRLYEKCGFSAGETHGPYLSMHLDLEDGSDECA